MAELGIGQQPVERCPKGSRVASRDENAGFSVDHEVAQASYRSRNDGPAMSHRLETGDPEAFPARGAGDYGGSRVEPLELVVRDEAERARNSSAERSVAGDDEL